MSKYLTTGSVTALQSGRIDGCRSNDMDYAEF